MATPTYRQIEAFKAVMEAGRVTDAAEKLSLSQPAVSKLLASFEAAIGIRLFSRDKKRLTPTAEALALLREVDRVFVGVARVSRFANELRSMRTGELTIASVAALGQRQVPRVIARLLGKHDSVNVGLHLRSSHEVTDWVASQKADVGISMMPVDHPAVRDELLCEVSAVCVLPNGHRLCDKPDVEPGDLAGENFISFMRDGRLRHVIDSVFEEARVSRELRIDTFMSDSACAFVTEGVGVSIVEPFTASEYSRRGELVVKPFRPSVLYQFRVLYPEFREPSLLARAFIAELRTSIRALSVVAQDGSAADAAPGKVNVSSRLQRKARGRPVARAAAREPG